ncbi:MAG: hypothetical protein ACLTNP_05530 [Streptococcus salivarius]
MLNNRYFLSLVVSICCSGMVGQFHRFGIFILAPIMGGIRATLAAKLLDIEA